ncbi:retrovirus-related Pol polyprotein from transposon 17.6 [Trichonephila inaurata madagascariensis]|uniref:Retrovirus-related Pol polyprotein from transposon 17.6 n=1 Tax=Trichonephila inaurata madagascariensis TaxID=2747483 RepID=A0A8X6XIE8_9ARAC|nr:retrovirus-related Pol polyprotein from transposon 17.6 [Trichonephila inaurata madagascariensis]
MKSAFNQIPLHLRDRHKTAFSTPDGDKYEFNRLCFGLKNSPNAFQSIAQEVLGDLLHNGASVYIDDIILFTKTIDEHFELLSKVLERFEKIQLKFNPGKCQFLTKSCKFWGKVYIKNFAKRALPLTNLLRKDIPFEWTSETQAAFEDIKEAILNPPVLALPDPAADLQITTDASSYGIGAVLEQNPAQSQKLFDNYIVHRGCPHKLIVDNATYFKGSEFLEFCKVMGIEKRHISTYSAHVNGRVEKPNQSIANILATITHDNNNWDEQLTHTMLALNSAIHEATYTSPFFLEHGRDIRLSYSYQKESDIPRDSYEYVEKLLPF